MKKVWLLEAEDVLQKGDKYYWSRKWYVIEKSDWGKKKGRHSEPVIRPIKPKAKRKK